MTYFFAITRDIVLFKIYFKSSVFSKQKAVVLRFEVVSDMKLSVWSFLLPWSCCFFLKLSKHINVAVLLLLFFFFFLTATNVLATSSVTFPSTRVFVYFFYFSIWFSPGSLMEINSRYVYFRSRIMLWFVDKKQKDKNTFKDNSQSEYSIC